MKGNILVQLILIALAVLGCNTGGYDILILNGEIYDGSGNTPFKADIGIKDSVIVTIGNFVST